MTTRRAARYFRPEDVPWRLSDHVQLRAVLVPLEGGYRTRADVIDKTLHIRRRWRRAVSRLRQLGWAPLDRHPGGRVAAALACPMTFLLARGRPRPCCLRMACPFCWAREALRHWSHIDRAFFAAAASPPAIGRAGRAIELDDTSLPTSGPLGRGRAHGLSLVSAHWSYPITPFVQTAAHGDLDQLACFYRARLEGVHPLIDVLPGFSRGPANRAALRAAGGPRRVGCFENVTADLSSGASYWRACIHQVWMLPADAPLSLIDPPAANSRVVDRINDPCRKDVAWAVARACRYPRALLSARDDGRPALQLVTARQGLRLAANYGAFRGAGNREV